MCSYKYVRWPRFLMTRIGKGQEIHKYVSSTCHKQPDVCINRRLLSMLLSPSAACASPRTHAPPLLKQLHWLPVSSRMEFKLCTLMYDINHGTAARYLTELVRRCDDSRLRSSVRGNFVVSRTRLRLTDKSFIHCRATCLECIAI